MKRRNVFSKTLAALLALVMLIGLLPVAASAEGSGSGTSAGTTATADDHLHLSKNAALQADGTWTITLEAYATGEVKTEVKTQVVPTDIILVLDQSGSMTNSDYYINIGAGTYSPVSTEDLPANKDMVNGTYYYWDANDQKYYPITTTRQIVKEDSYWVYTDSIKYDSDGNITSYDTVCLASDPNVGDIIGTSWTVVRNNTDYTVNFDSGKGYLKSEYLQYTMSRSGNGGNRRYSYNLTSYGSAITDPEATPVSDESNTNDAYNALVSYIGGKYSNMTVTSTTVGNGGNRTYYALAYVPVELVNNDVYYYTYSYVDDLGQTWVIGHSAQDTGVGDNIAEATYDASTLGAIYVENTTSGSRLTALKNAATAFINDMQAAAAAHAVDHRIAVVGFSGNDGTGNSQDDYQYVNSELFIGANQYNYYDAADGDPASAYYDQAFQSVNTTAGYNNLIASIGALEGNGPTYTSVGFNLATGIAEENAGDTNVYTSGKRKLVVVFMTDGEPGWSGYESGEATSTVNLATALETTYGATVYTVALLDSAPTDGGNVDNFLNNVTSDGVTGTGNNKYTLATDGVSLTNFFHSIEISVDTSYSTVELSENAFLVDRVSEYFNMPAGITVENMKDYVTIYTADHLGNNEFGSWNQITYEIAASVDKEDTLKADTVHAWLTYSDSDGLAHGVTIHNFDYLSSDNMVTTQNWAYDDANGNDVYDDGEMLVPVDQAGTLADPHYTMLVSGKKLIIVIKGITSKGEGAQDYYINTNNDHSGLWDLAEDGTYGMLEAFPMPHAMLVNRVYILDYAKEACLDTLDHTRNALALDSAKDGVMSPVDTDKPITQLTTADDVKDAQGNTVKALQFGDAYIKTENDRSKVFYNPKTTNWDGYDTFYVFWHAGNSYDDSTGNLVYSDGDPNTGYGWSKVNVMPANNVYYEDTFVTTSTDGTTATGTVGIEFGSGWTFTTVGDNAGENTEKPESAGQDSTLGTHGWVDSLADDPGHTDGTVAVGDGTNNSATATFTFTGTGVDLYSYTNKTTGTIMVIVKAIDVPDEYRVPTRYYVVDNYAASGDYYQIPTVSYTARGKLKNEDGTVAADAEEVLVHGTYQVTIQVTNEAANVDQGRVTYYLDGIRIYNPLSYEHENDPIVSEGYGDEVHAFFYNIREFLISENDFVANNSATGAVFIDQIKADQVADGTETGTGVTTTTIGTYVDYGPKNEVYLAKDQMIVMKVDIAEGRRWFVSLKSPTGTATTAEISNGENTSSVTVGHTADLYYEVVPTADASDPSFGYIAIKNTGDALLSVAKYQITGLDPTPDNTSAGDEDSSTDTQPDTSGTESTQSDPGAAVLAISDDEAVTYASAFSLMRSVPYTGTDAETDTESDVTDASPDNTDSPNVEITNPDTEESPSKEEQIAAQIEALVAKLFTSIRNWFNS